MTLTITLDRPNQSRPNRLRQLKKVLVAAIVTVVTQALSPAKPALANLAHIPLTVAGIGCVDYASFHIGGGWGWLVTGLSLLVLEHLIADEKLCALGSVH